MTYNFPCREKFSIIQSKVETRTEPELNRYGNKGVRLDRIDFYKISTTEPRSMLDGLELLSDCEVFQRGTFFFFKCSSSIPYEEISSKGEKKSPS